MSRKKKSVKELSLGKSKENQLGGDIYGIGSKDGVGELVKNERDVILAERNHNNQFKHQRQDSEVQLRKTTIMFDIRKSVEKIDVRNRKMSLPARYGPIIPHKVGKRSSKENN